MHITDRRDVPQCTLEQYEKEFAGRHLLHHVIGWWAERNPDAPAIISYDRKQVVDWATLNRVSADLARRLLRLGFEKGDFLAASLPMSLEHIFLEYACFRIGVIHAPLDLRLRPPEALRCLGLIKPKGFAFLILDLAGIVKSNCPFVEHYWSQSELAEMIAGGSQGRGPESPVDLSENDGAQVIFTTGSTGSPKPALLSHRNITCQNFCLGAAFGFNERSRLLLNLPPSHVGGQAEALMTSLFWGGAAVTLEIFDPARSLDAIQQYRVTLLGQIPAMFQFEWHLSDFAKFDLSSLERVIYGGQQVSQQFLERMAQMAPLMGTGLGLTETAGFCTYTPMTSAVDDLSAGIGFDMPAYAISIRREMRADGSAGGALHDGEVGHICFSGPQTFLGYVNDPAATARAISSDGYLYTGDIGRKDDRGLHFSGRAKWIIKPAGYQVFPGDVENHVCALETKVAGCGVVGAEHRLLSEGIVAFVEKRPGAELTMAELRQHAHSMTSYMRPLHYVILEPGQLPLNRVVKVDYIRLSEMAKQEVDRLRARGRWDR